MSPWGVWVGCGWGVSGGSVWCPQRASFSFLLPWILHPEEVWEWAPGWLWNPTGCQGALWSWFYLFIHLFNIKTYSRVGNTLYDAYYITYRHLSWSINCDMYWIRAVKVGKAMCKMMENSFNSMSRCLLKWSALSFMADSFSYVYFTAELSHTFMAVQFMPRCTHF